MAIKFIPIDPKYITSEIVFDGSKTTMRITIAKEGIPEGAKKINFVYWYTTTNNTTPEEPDVEQPKSGTVKSVAIDIPIDSNTTYPITGEFEIDGTPASINAELKVKKTYGVFNASIYEFGHDYNSYGQYGQVETLRYNNYSSPGGLAIVGSNYDK